VPAVRASFGPAEVRWSGTVSRRRKNASLPHRHRSTLLLAALEARPRRPSSRPTGCSEFGHGLRLA
jgi:hypothetical protein